MTIVWTVSPCVFWTQRVHGSKTSGWPRQPPNIGLFLSLTLRIFIPWYPQALAALLQTKIILFLCQALKSQCGLIRWKPESVFFPLTFPSLWKMTCNTLTGFLPCASASACFVRDVFVSGFPEAKRQVWGRWKTGARPKLILSHFS